MVEEVTLGSKHGFRLLGQEGHLVLPLVVYQRLKLVLLALKYLSHGLVHKRRCFVSSSNLLELRPGPPFIRAKLRVVGGHALLRSGSASIVCRTALGAVVSDFRVDYVVLVRGEGSKSTFVLVVLLECGQLVERSVSIGNELRHGLVWGPLGGHEGDRSLNVNVLGEIFVVVGIHGVVVVEKVAHRGRAVDVFHFEGSGHLVGLVQARLPGLEFFLLFLLRDLLRRLVQGKFRRCGLVFFQFRNR